MAFPKPLRLQLGLSLAEFADLLNTNVGQLSMVESGLRSLPTTSLEIADSLQKAMNSSKAQPIADNKLSKKVIALLNKEIRIGQAKLEALQMQELKLAEKLNAAKCLFSLSQEFTRPLPPPQKEEVDLQMAVLQRKATKKVEQYEVKLIQLQLQITSVQALIFKANEILLN